MSRSRRAFMFSLLFHGAVLGAMAGFLPPPLLPPLPRGPVEVSWARRAIPRGRKASPRTNAVSLPFAELPLRTSAAAAVRDAGPETAGRASPADLRAYLATVFAEVERRILESNPASSRTSGSAKIRMTVQADGSVRDIETVSAGSHALAALATAALKRGALPAFPPSLRHLPQLRLILPIEMTGTRRL